MAKYPHSVLLAKLDVIVRTLKIPDIRPGMQAARLKFVVRRNGIEMLQKQFPCFRLAVTHVEGADSRADKETVRIGILERNVRKGLFLLGATGKEKQ